MAQHSKTHRMHPVTDLIAFGEARSRMIATFDPIQRTQRLPLAEAAGRVLAEDVIAPFDVPNAPRSAMDGYAVRAADTATSGNTLRLAGALHAGDTGDGLRVSAGTCIQVATGALVPRGADAVVMVEHTNIDGDQVRVDEAVELGQFVVPKGSDIHRAQRVLPAGAHLSAFRLAVAAALGQTHVTVRARPRIRVFASGNEVRPVGDELKPGQVYDSNAYGLGALLAKAGAEVEHAPVLPDTPEAWDAAFSDLNGWDAVVLSGGSSAGERDLAAEILGRLGRIVFHGVRVKPGRPLLLAVVHEVPVVVLPGFPASCLIDAAVFLTPAVRRMSRVPDPPPGKLHARLGHVVRSPPDKHQIVPVRLEDGKAVSTFRDSGATTSLADAVGYFEIDETTREVPEGTEVEITPFP